MTDDDKATRAAIRQLNEWRAAGRQWSIGLADKPDATEPEAIPVVVFEAISLLIHAFIRRGGELRALEANVEAIRQAAIVSQSARAVRLLPDEASKLERVRFVSIATMAYYGDERNNEILFGLDDRGDVWYFDVIHHEPGEGWLRFIPTPERPRADS